MQRREFLGGVGLLGAHALAGCVEGSSTKLPQTPTAVDSVANWTFDTDEVSERDGVDEKPEITCLPDKRRVRISGKMYSGSECQLLGVTSIGRDAERFRFTVGVYEVREDNCSNSVEISQYEAAFEFQDSMPSTVVALESWNEQERRAEKQCGG